MKTSAFSLEGALSVSAALKAGRREIFEILIDDDKRFDQRLNELRLRAKEAAIKLKYVSSSEIEAYARGNSHGGVIALADARRFEEMADLIPPKKPAFVVMLDGIEDPYNFGFAVRALYAAGADGLVLRERNWTSASAIVGRSSAGASELMPIALAESAMEAASFFRQRGLVVATAAKSSASLSLFEAELRQPVFVVFGGERRGVTRSFQREADLLLEIPYGRPFGQSLGAVSAVSILAYEVMRQRRHSGEGADE
ncbi:MAG: RNA methyltransferase [Chloroflexota bacterium]|nr:RNA methyltransferase [Chloroflexota bacterium]